MNQKALLLIISVLVAASVFASTANATVIQTDKTGTVTSVIDGSTFTISTGETIKLAEITTPASGEAGFESSRSYLANMIQGKPIILDVDTLVVSEQGKLLSVAYLDFNSSHYENINKAMLENNYAAPTSTRTTEFNPATWTWFIAKETAATPTPTAAATATATPSPTPTPFSGPTPSITPDISQPTATPRNPTTSPENTEAAAQMQTWIIIAIVGVIAAAIIIILIIKRRK